MKYPCAHHAVKLLSTAIKIILIASLISFIKTLLVYQGAKDHKMPETLIVTINIVLLILSIIVIIIELYAYFIGSKDQSNFLKAFILYIIRAIIVIVTYFIVKPEILIFFTIASAILDIVIVAIMLNAVIALADIEMKDKGKQLKGFIIVFSAILIIIQLFVFKVSSSSTLKEMLIVAIIAAIISLIINVLELNYLQNARDMLYNMKKVEVENEFDNNY